MTRDHEVIPASVDSGPGAASRTRNPDHPPPPQLINTASDRGSESAPPGQAASVPGDMEASASGDMTTSASGDKLASAPRDVAASTPGHKVAPGDMTASNHDFLTSDKPLTESFEQTVPFGVSEADGQTADSYPHDALSLSRSPPPISVPSHLQPRPEVQSASSGNSDSQQEESHHIPGQAGWPRYHLGPFQAHLRPDLETLSGLRHQPGLEPCSAAVGSGPGLSPPPVSGTTSSSPPALAPLLSSPPALAPPPSPPSVSATPPSPSSVSDPPPSPLPSSTPDRLPPDKPPTGSLSFELWLKIQKIKSRGVHYSVSLPRGLIISILFILNIVSTYLMKLVTVCDHPLPLDASDWARPGRPKNKDMHDCEKCGVSFVRTKALQHHKNCKHTKIETKMKAKCKWCPYSSSLKSNVKRHEHICRARPQIVKTLSPDAIWRIGMYQLFICLISHRKYSDNSQKKV